LLFLLYLLDIIIIIVIIIIIIFWYLSKAIKNYSIQKQMSNGRIHSSLIQARGHVIMRKIKQIDNLMITAFVDDQLDAVNCEIIINAIEVDRDLRDRVNALRKTKELMKLAYGPGSLDQRQ